MTENNNSNYVDAFVEQMGPTLYLALQRHGVKNINGAFANMMRQLALESDYGRSSAARNQNNFGGVGFNGKTYSTYKDLNSFVDSYVKLMNSRYARALAVHDPREYTKIIHGLHYFGALPGETEADALARYSNNMSSMRSLNNALAKHVKANPDIYPREGFINGTPKSIYRPEQDKVIVPFWAPTLNIDPQEELKVELAPPTMIQRLQEEPETVLTPTIVDKLKEALQVFDMFGLNNSKKKSSLPELIPDLDEYMKLEQENYFRDIMSIGDVYDNLYAYNSRLPKPLGYFKYGKLPMFANGGIYINPANRGKFNATKKRTGKTTEELTHSKNPLTRKRAIFALNAKKWKH